MSLETSNPPTAAPQADGLPAQPRRHSLTSIFHPKTVAVIGATEKPDSVGRTVLWNLVSNPFGGVVFPVNPKRSSVLGIKAYPSIKDVPEPVDLAVIVTPAASVPEAVSQCADAQVKGVIVISAGFKELGDSGAELENQVIAQARRGGMRLIGPNCLGVMNPITGLNATFAGRMARPGHVAFISQSGALLTAVLDWSDRQRIGFSSIVSIGSMLDVSWGDLIDYLGNDSQTHAILMYMESIGDARAFLSAAREVALSKPIIVIKPGRTEQAARAAASHTGALTGGDEVIEAAFRRCGVLRVGNISDLFYMADVLAKQPRPRGPRLTIVTNAGGPGVLATDALITTGGQVAEISAQTMQELNQLLPPAWSRNNPIDILGDADAARYEKTLRIAASDPNSDGLLVILTPQDMTESTATAEQLCDCAKLGESVSKPILASWMGGPDVSAGKDILNRAGIPTFSYPDAAARMFTHLWHYTYNLRGLYETPTMLPDEEGSIDRPAAEQIIVSARKVGRTLLTEQESKSLLSAYGIPVVPSFVAIEMDQAGRLAERLGFPVVLKLHSTTITHKTDVGGVRLNLRDRLAVESAFADIRNAVGSRAFEGVSVQPMVSFKDAYELILGSSNDPQFGPVLLFGTGGQLVEVYKDRSLGLPPLNATLARRMMEQTKIYQALNGVRGRNPVDLAALEMLLVRFSQLVIEQKWIKEIDVNPLLASPQQLLALDARVVLHDTNLAEGQLPVPAIRPYPTQYIRRWKLKDGTKVEIRPIRPEDEPKMVRFHKTLGERTVRMRYFGPLALDLRTTHERLTRVCFNDYDRELALVADYYDAESSQHEIMAVGRLSRIPHTTQAEFAVVISDGRQNQGLGSELMRLLVDAARAEKITRMKADILPENLEMQHICEQMGFTLTNPISGDSVVRAEMNFQ